MPLLSTIFDMKIAFILFFSLIIRLGFSQVIQAQDTIVNLETIFEVSVVLQNDEAVYGLDISFTYPADMLSIDTLILSKEIREINKADFITNTSIDSGSIHIWTLFPIKKPLKIFYFRLKSLKKEGVAILKLNKITVNENIIEEKNISIKIVKEEQFIPNLFSPNNDGKNDFFEIPSLEGLVFHLQIYDRSGLLVYDNSSNNGWWDGTKNNKNCEEGSYFYFLEFDKKTTKGAVKLIR